MYQLRNQKENSSNGFLQVKAENATTSLLSFKCNIELGQRR